MSDNEAQALNNIKKILRARGRRITAQRSLLLQIVHDSKGHLDAHEIYHLARQEIPLISLSTVYRTLNMLKEMELIIELHFPEDGHHYYEFKDETEHHHLICSVCGQIVEFESALIKQLRDQVGQQNDFEVRRVHIDMSGLCARCRQEKANADV